MPGLNKSINVIIWLITFQLASRGADYLSGNPKPGAGVFSTSDTTPALMWGVTCLVVAAAVTVGMVLKAPRVVCGVACVAVCVYLSFAVLVFDDAIRDGLDDWRFFTSYMTAAGVWGVVAYELFMHIAVMESREGDNGNRRTVGAAGND